MAEDAPQNRVRLALLLWLAIWPLLTILLAVVDPIVGSYPLPVRTAIATIILVPSIVIVILPFLANRFATWLAG